MASLALRDSVCANLHDDLQERHGVGPGRCVLGSLQPDENERGGASEIRGAAVEGTLAMGSKDYGAAVRSAGLKQGALPGCPLVEGSAQSMRVPLPIWKR